MARLKLDVKPHASAAAAAPPAKAALAPKPRSAGGSPEKPKLRAAFAEALEEFKKSAEASAMELERASAPKNESKATARIKTARAEIAEIKANAEIMANADDETAPSPLAEAKESLGYVSKTADSMKVFISAMTADAEKACNDTLSAGRRKGQDAMRAFAASAQKARGAVGGAGAGAGAQ